MTSHETTRVGILGGGFVGVTLAAHLLQKSHVQVNLFEANSTKIESFKSGDFLVHEPGMPTILEEALERRDLQLNGHNFPCDLFFICIGTPKSESVTARFESMIKACELALDNLRPGGVLFLRSTVEVGASRRLFDELVKIRGRDFHMCFAPERTAEGRALEELSSLPQIIGGVNRESLVAGSLSLKLLGFKVLEASSSDVSEFSKLACNTWRDVTFAFANELAYLGEYFQLDAREGIKLANADYPRARIPKPGPVGGPCLSKDSYILRINLEDQQLKKPSVISAAREINESLVDYVSDKIVKIAEVEGVIDVMIIGAAFKGHPRTNDVRNSIAESLVHIFSSSPLVGVLEIWDQELEEEDLGDLAQYWSRRPTLVGPRIIVIANDAAWISKDEQIEFFLNLESSSLIMDLWGLTTEWPDLRAEISILGKG